MRASGEAVVSRRASGPGAGFVTCLLFVLGAVLSCSVAALEPRHLGVIVNTQDPLSVQIGRTYAAARQISFQNIIKVAFPPDGAAISSKAFASIKESVDAQTLEHVQAYALTWIAPYRVECMSITSAFAFGFDPAYCSDGCGATRTSAYFNSRARLPFRQFGVRPAMVIAARSLDAAKTLIDRGVRSDGTRPSGRAYLLSTTDSARNVRSGTYGYVQGILGDRARLVQADSIKDVSDVLFYFTGRAHVEELDTLRFLPGAMADHLTSFGGQLTDSVQMSALRWLEAGATGMLQGSTTVP